MPSPLSGDRGQARLCLLALGGNLDDPPAAFRRAVSTLSDAGFLVRRLSSFLRSQPVGCEPDAPVFFNAAVSGFWTGAPLELLALCQRIEAENGRPNEHPHHRSRTLDIDIILFGTERINLPSLTVPHPRAAQRDFVLLPLREIEPDLESLLTRL